MLIRPSFINWKTNLNKILQQRLRDFKTHEEEDNVGLTRKSRQ